MSKEEALSKIQQKIDDPMIEQAQKRQLFSLYQTVKKARTVSSEVAAIINSFKKKDR